MNVFDFDNTIYDGESGIDLFTFYLKRYPDLLKFAPKVATALVRYKLRKITIDKALQLYAPYVEEFLRRLDDPEKDMREFWDLHQHKIKPFYEDLRREDDLVISASPEGELAEICGRLGIKQYLGSVIDEETRQITRFNFRQNKVKYFREKYPDAEIDTLFTDSFNDRWLMDIAKHVVLVDGDKYKRIK
ncbi:MAG: haloacid dehalogenase-like hydrolase [Oscillospiraceae bacterium]|jgi:phosphoserine phosphatase|nr:haloacid dehalogenase-like hydrolase [Oscillospiraceae bacterium]